MKTFVDTTGDHILRTWDAAREGAADVGRSAIADVQNAYQNFLTADATVGPAQGTPGATETVTWEEERDYGLPVLETDPAPDFAAEAQRLTEEHEQENARYLEMER